MTIRLVDPRRIKDPKRRRRVQVLHETMEMWKQNHTTMRELATSNLERWSKSPKHKEPTEMRLIVVEGDTLDVVGICTKGFGTMFACINMANSVNPGGGYMYGCAAQEENIARRTQLHFRFNKTVVDENEIYRLEMQELISGNNGEVYLSEKPLICMRGREVFERNDLGYEPLSDDEIFISSSQLLMSLQCAGLFNTTGDGGVFLGQPIHNLETPIPPFDGNSIVHLQPVETLSLR